MAGYRQRTSNAASRRSTASGRSLAMGMVGRRSPAGVMRPPPAAQLPRLPSLDRGRVGAPDAKTAVGSASRGCYRTIRSPCQADSAGASLGDDRNRRHERSGSVPERRPATPGSVASWRECRLRNTTKTAQTGECRLLDERPPTTRLARDGARILRVIGTEYRRAPVLTADPAEMPTGHPDRREWCPREWCATGRPLRGVA